MQFNTAERAGTVLGEAVILQNVLSVSWPCGSHVCTVSFFCRELFLQETLIYCFHITYPIDSKMKCH